MRNYCDKMNCEMWIKDKSIPNLTLILLLSVTVILPDVQLNSIPIQTYAKQT